MASSPRHPETTRPEEVEIEDRGSGVQRVVWAVETDHPLSALTFDDGPDPEFTPRILEILEYHDVRATFMAMGYNAVRHSHLLREVVAAGHEIGSHTWSHIKLTNATPRQARAEIEHGAREVQDEAGVRVRYFRPPHGRLSDAAMRIVARLGHDIVVWSVTRGELGWQDPDLVSSHVVDSLGPGEIVDFHDGIGRATFDRSSDLATRLRRRRATEIEALPRILEGARARGLRLVTMSELLAAWRPNDPRSLDGILGMEGGP